MKFICDENVAKPIIDRLKFYGYDIVSIKEKFSGISDSEIVQLTNKNNYCIITFDKDFLEMRKFNKNFPQVIFLKFINFKKGDFILVSDFLHKGKFLRHPKSLLMVEFNDGNLSVY